MFTQHPCLPASHPLPGFYLPACTCPHLTHHVWCVHWTASQFPACSTYTGLGQQDRTTFRVPWFLPYHHLHDCLPSTHLLPTCLCPIPACISTPYLPCPWFGTFCLLHTLPTLALPHTHTFLCHRQDDFAMGFYTWDFYLPHSFALGLNVCCLGTCPLVLPHTLPTHLCMPPCLCHTTTATTHTIIFFPLFCACTTTCSSPTTPATTDRTFCLPASSLSLFFLYHCTPPLILPVPFLPGRKDFEHSRDPTVYLHTCLPCTTPPTIYHHRLACTGTVLKQTFTHLPALLPFPGTPLPHPCPFTTPFTPGFLPTTDARWDGWADGLPSGQDLFGQFLVSQVGGSSPDFGWVGTVC